GAFGSRTGAPFEKRRDESRRCKHECLRHGCGGECEGLRIGNWCAFRKTSREVSTLQARVWLGVVRQVPMKGRVLCLVPISPMRPFATPNAAFMGVCATAVRENSVVLYGRPSVSARMALSTCGQVDDPGSMTTKCPASGATVVDALSPARLAASTYTGACVAN